MNEMAISHEHAHADTPEYNAAAGRGLGLLREETTASLEDRAEGNSNNLWAEMMGMACGMGSICVSSAQAGGISPIEKWYDILPTPGGIQPFDTAVYMRATTRKHKLEPRGVRCIMARLARDHPRGSFWMRNLATLEVVCRQDMSCHLAAAE